MKRKKKMIIRWSIVTSAVIAIFWTTWYLICGSVPVVTSIKMTPNWTYVLPFGISRWWDVLVGPIWSTILILLLTSQWLKEDERLTDALTVGLVFGLPFGLVFGLGFGLDLGLGFGLAVGLVYGLGTGLVFGLGTRLGTGLGFGLGTGLVFGLAFGLAFSLGTGLALGLGFGLGFGLAALSKLIANYQTWKKVWNWLLGR